MKLMSLCLLIAFIALGAFLAISHAAIDSNSIRGVWLFDESSGNVAIDSSGNKNDGTIHGAKRVNGKFGKALEFDGTNNWVEVPHSDSVAFEKGVSFTITVHFKGTKVGGSLVGKNYEDRTQAAPWYLLWNGGAANDNKVSLYLRTNADQNSKVDSTSDLGDDEWHFVVGRADVQSKKVSIWIDGKMEVEGPMVTDDGYGTSDGVLHFGRHHDRYTAGIIDEVGLFSIALSEDEMNTIRNRGLEEAATVEPINKLTLTWADLKR